MNDQGSLNFKIHTRIICFNVASLGFSTMQIWTWMLNAYSTSDINIFKRGLQPRHLLLLIEMFRRVALLVKKALPLSGMLASCYLSVSIPQMVVQNHTDFLSTLNIFHKNHPRIKFVRDLGEYVDKLLIKDRSIIIFQLTGDNFIDDQVIALAQRFVMENSDELSTDYQFIFLQGHSLSGEKDEENYFILYGPNGEKLINIDPYINKCKTKPGIKLDVKPLNKRLIESLNLYRQVSIENICKQLSKIQNDSSYVALIATSQKEYQTQSAKRKLKTFEKKYTTKAKNVCKFIVKDQHARRILGLKKKNEEGVYLLVPDNKNLRKQFRQKAQFVSINGKRYTSIEASTVNLDQIFIFPPIQKNLQPSDYVINVYLNKNQLYEQIENKIFEELSKPQYKKYPKALYYTSDIEEAGIYFQKNDYSTECLKAYEVNTKLSKDEIKHILSNTFQYQFLLSAKEGINSAKLQAWLKDCESGKAEQHFPSQKSNEFWAQQITGEQYKSIIQQPADKVIYHYSHHCHGCKKFGGKFEQFAKNKKIRHPWIDFYRINNDNNKSEGVRNYNSTPIFVFYKKDCPNPFIYKMPIFTEQLFDSFLNITSQLRIIPQNNFEKHIQNRAAGESLVKQFLSESGM